MGFDLLAPIEKMIAFIREMSRGLSNKFVAEISEMSVRTIQKIMKGITSLEHNTYYRVIAALGKYHGRSKAFMAEKMRQCEDVRIIWRLDD